MIQIEVFNWRVPGGRGFAKLFENVRVNFVIDNLALNATATPGEYTLPIEFPRNSFNDLLFDFVHDLHKLDRVIEFKAWVYFKGVPLYKGTLVIVESGKTHDGHIRLNISGIPCLKTNLRQINYGDPVILGATEEDRYAALGLMINQIYPNTPVNFPVIWSPNFFDGKNNAYLEFLNLYNPATGTLERNIIDGVYRDGNNPYNANAIVPFVYLVHIIIRAFLGDNIKVEGTFMDDADIQKILIYQNKSLDNPEIVTGNKVIADKADSFTIPYNDYDFNWAYQDTIINLNEILDEDHIFEPTLGEFTVSTEGWHTISGATTLAILDTDEDFEIAIATIIDGTTPGPSPVWGENAFFLYTSPAGPGASTVVYPYTMKMYFTAADIGKTVTLKFATKTTFSTGVLTNEITCFSFNMTIQNESTVQLNTLPDYFYLFNYVPDITFGELLQAYKDSHNLIFKYDLINDKVIINFAEEAFDEPVFDITDIAEPEHSITFTSQKIKSFAFEIDSTDGLSQDPHEQPNDSTIVADLDSNAYLPYGGVLTGDKYYVKNMNVYVIAVVDAAGIPAWYFHSYGFEPYVVGTEGAEIIAKNQPMAMGYEYYPLVPPWLTEHPLCVVPRIFQVGSTNAYGVGDHPYNLRQVMYLGRISHSGGLDFPSASSNNRNYSGGAIAGRTLLWDREYGTIEKCWQKWITGLNSGFPVTVNVNFKLWQLLNFNIYQRFRFHNNILLMKKLELGIDDQIHTCKAELILLGS